MILKQIGLGGLFPILIHDFLINRSFRGRVTDELSEIQSQENGFPQGSPLCYLRLTLTAKFLATILQHPNIPACKYIFEPPSILPPPHQPPVSILPKLLFTTPPWLFSPPIIFSLSQFSKASNSPTIFQKHFQKIIQSFRDPILFLQTAPKAVMNPASLSQ